MKLNYTLKKILPGLLIVMILSVGIFGAFGIETTYAQQFEGDGTSGGWEEDSWWDTLKNTTTAIIELPETLAKWVGYTMTLIPSAILGISGALLNKSIDFSVRNMGTNLGDDGIGPVIAVGWKMFRDLANIILIFALLVIGIATILRLERYGMKALLAKLIIVALLINFSMFFTKVVIDSSNLLAVQFYKMAETEGRESSSGNWTGIADSYQQAFRLVTIFGVDSQGANTLEGTNLEWYQIIIVSGLASILFLIAAFALFAAAFLFIIRYIVLIFLIVLSPLAFVGIILPKTQNLAGKWWSALLSYSFFAPIFLLLTWFTIKLINSDAFQAGIGLTDSMKFSDISQKGAEAVNSMPLFLNFALAIGFIIGSLILAKQMGGYGSSAVMSWGHSARKWGQGVVGRNTVGRSAGLAGQGLNKAGEKLEEWAPTGRVGRTFRSIGIGATKGTKKATKGVESLKFGSSTSRIDVQRKVVKEAEEDKKVAKRKEAEESNKKISAAISTGIPIANRDAVIGGLSKETIASLSPAQLKSPQVAPHLTLQHLQHLQGSGGLSMSDKTAIRNEILVAGIPGPTLDYMNIGSGTVFWS